MSLKPFTYPFPETRFLHAGPNVYKFKIRYGNSIRGEEIEDKGVIVQELEDSIRAVLANMDSLQPFVTEHFIVFPYSDGSSETKAVWMIGREGELLSQPSHSDRDALVSFLSTLAPSSDKSKWERVSHLKFKHGESILTPYPFVFTLYIEMKWFAEDLPSGKPADDIPLELVLAETEAEEATMRKWKRKLMEEPSSPSRQGPHRAKMETSSEASSNKKPLKESKRSRNEEAQQEYQDTPASNAIAVKEQDATLGHGLQGLVVPPLQHSSPPPLKEPGARGFLGFLSALFPFRYFFKKSGQ